ncbi:hypothetical protein SEA_KRAMPUS_6 [Microbacterium phage Krampus]|uniref:Uncharacterized protein n=1 Tax=Microbacterium phage Krampus TaxID=2201435 RepID=A0A2Z4Q6K3_9CAUD|nr:hypothetical protein HOT40_gp06 [Microbacterium phage Krampus]AWY05103.1 hypothetical protein SEA_KRAMPUS_6 [Microbacterium phage Krampus]
MTMATTDTTEAAQLIQERISKYEKDLEGAQMNKQVAERQVRDQQTIIDITTAAIASLKADLAKITPAQEPEPEGEGEA